MKIRDNLIRLRKFKNLSIYQLSKDTELNESVIRKIESGERINPSIITIDKLCKSLGVSIDDFVNKDLEVLDMKRKMVDNHQKGEKYIL